jgi:PAS domain S-box-containing protein
VVTDISDKIRNENELKKRARELKESEERYRSLFEMAPDPIITFDLKGYITSVNDAGLRLTGYTKDEVVGKHFTKLGMLMVKSIPSFMKMFKSLLKGDTLETFEVPVQSKDGSLIWGDVHVSLLQKNGQKAEILAMWRDITDKKKLNEKILEQVDNLEFLDIPEVHAQEH